MTPRAAGPSALDDPAGVAEGDPGGMLGYVAALGDQLAAGFEVARQTPALPSAEGLRSVVVCGMGGSGMAGDVLRGAFGHDLAVPVQLCKGYTLPASCDGDALVLAVSYSGDTEETVAAYTEAAARGCRLVAVSSGGTLAALAEADEVPRVALPPSSALPRAALGFLAAAPLGVLDAMGLLSAADDVRAVSAELRALARSLAPGVDAASNEAKAVAAWLGDRIPVVWGSEGPARAAATRWKTQFNENAKRPAFDATLPELDHNEIEGWSARFGAGHAVVVLRHGLEHPRIAPRVEATIEAVRPSGLEVRQVRTASPSALGVVLALVMLGDFVSVYAAVAAGVDPSPIPVLSGLKARLRP